jgi:replication factor C subunit 3/5
MVLWVDKYRPDKLSKLDFHPELTERLLKLVESSDFPHTLFFGPSGAGKKTRVHALLRELYGPGVNKQRVQHKTIKLKSKTIEISCISSNYHIELNPSDVGMNDKHVISEVLTEIAQTQNVASVTGESSGATIETVETAVKGEEYDVAMDGSAGSGKAFKVVILNEVDRLSLQAQQALRRTMEKYTSTCRLILIAESLSRVIAPLRSRCFPIRVSAPSEDEIIQRLMDIARSEKVSLSEELAGKIATESDRNLRRAVLMLEALKVKSSGAAASGPVELDASLKVKKADWQQFIDEMAKLICAEQSPKQLMTIRGKFYELLANCVPPDTIMKTLVDCLLRRVDDEIKQEIVHWAALYDHRMACGSKPIFHLEAFVAKFMAIYKKWVIESFGM